MVYTRKWKPEVRIVGVEAAGVRGDYQLCVCVVVRGSSWIDGSFTLWWRVSDVASLVRGIKSSPFYEELTAVVFSSSLPLRGRVHEVASSLEKPALLVAGVEGSLVECSGLSVEEAESLLRTCRGPFGVEALRLASLLAPLAKALYDAWKPLNLALQGS